MPIGDSSVFCTQSQADKLVLAIQDLGSVKWFNIWNGYRFVNRNDTKGNVLFTAFKINNPRKFFHSIGYGTLEMRLWSLMLWKERRMQKLLM